MMTQSYGITDSPSTAQDDTTRTRRKKQSVVISEFRRALPQFCVVGVKNLILLGWGLLLGYPTILIPGLQGKSGNNSTGKPEFELSDEQISWLGSINMLCVPVGSLASGLLMEPLGKRRMMQLLNVPMLASWAIFYFAKDISHIYIALCLSGISGGLLEAPLLIYIAETVQPRYRGMLTASGTATALGGVCLGFIIGSMLHWRTVAAISAIFPFLAILAVFLVPESPYWLYARNRVDDAHKSLQWLRGWVSHHKVEEEFKDVISSVEDLKATKKPQRAQQRINEEMIEKRSKLKPFTERTFIAPFLLVFFGFIVCHFSGLTPLQTFSIQILSSYHVPINEYYGTIFLGAAQVIGCLIGMAFVRSAGKRRLVFTSFIGCGVCFFAVATHSHFSNFDSQRFDITPTAATLNASIEYLDRNVLNTITSLRTRYRIERETGNAAISQTNPIQNDTNQHQKFNLSYYQHINSDILTETQLLLAEMNLQSFPEMDHMKKFDKLARNTFLTFNSTVIVGSNSRQMGGNSTRIQDEISVDQLIELLDITKNIVVPLLPNALPKNNATKLSISRLNEMTDDMWNMLTSIVTINESHLEEKVNELSITLSNVGEKIRLGTMVQRRTNYQWLPLILLLAGSMFAHCGAKLFPWMLIGECFPMEVRSAAAGFSSALAYWVGFASNKLFLNMVSAFTLNGTFWFYSGVCVVAVIVLYFTLPETENKTLQEIQVYFEKKKDTAEISNSHVTSNETSNT